MPEFIFEVSDALYDEATGQICIKPEYKGKLTRCKDCEHYAGEGMYCAENILVPFDHFYCYYSVRKENDKTD